MVKIAPVEFNGDGHVPDTTQRYLYPLKPAVTPVTVNVGVVTPAYGAPFAKLL